MARAIGMVECTTVSTGFKAADEMAKAADVEILQAEVTCPGKFVILVAGELSAVRASVDRICMREDFRGILSGNMVGWQKFTRHLDKILHDRRQKLALMPRQMNGILKRKIRKIDPGNGTESQLSFEHSAWQNCEAKPQADGFENGLL